MKYPQLVSMPSAVSIWLEEQLEARGIDAVVYTRYILSLLHTHTVDVIYPDEDLHFSRMKKNCEIESLVDELCEKLKEVDSDDSKPSSPSDQLDLKTTGASKEVQKYKITPQELAEKYYAAFPPLCPQSPSKLTSLLPKWKPTNSPIKNKSITKQSNRQTTHDTNPHCNMDADKMNGQHKHYLKYQHKRYLKYLNRTMYDMYIDCTDDVASRYGGTPCADISDENDDCTDENSNEDEDEEVMMYDDLPVDIKNLLDSPCPGDDTVEKMNVANMTDIGKRNFIPYGTSKTSSIWSNDWDNVLESETPSDLYVPPWHGIKNKTETIDFARIAETQLEVLRFTESRQYRESIEKKRCEKGFFAASLLKLNHNKEKSCFTEIIPNSRPTTSWMFGSNGTYGIFSSFSPRQITSLEGERVDLIDTDHWRFRPIKEKPDNTSRGEHADGATFNISNNLEKVDYKRSESGSMFLETEFGECKTYQEYRLRCKNISSKLEFTPRFSICQNDKACQTEDLSKVNPEEAIEEKPFDSLFLRTDRWRLPRRKIPQNRGGPPKEKLPSQELLDDIDRDAELLFSDLNLVLNGYLSELPVTQKTGDIKEEKKMLPIGPKERKPAHSFICDTINFVEGPCLIKLPTLASVRTVTL